jgi:ribokinase
MRKMDAVGFGALNLDRLYKVDRLADAGTHQEILNSEECPGGSAANTIAGLANLGLSTGFIGAVGDDAEGEIMLKDFAQRGVDTKGVSILKARTGFIIGFVDARGERTLYPHPGANSKLAFSPKQAAYAKRAKILHLSSFVDEKQLEAQKKLVSQLPKSVKISFSPGGLYSRKGMKALLPIIERSHVVFLNEEEIKALTGKGHAAGSRVLIDAGAKMVAATLGGRGCFVSDGKSEHMLPAEKVEVIDTTGAGDAYAAGFLFALIKGKNIEEAGKLGNKMAALCITALGARTSLPTMI